MESVLLLAVKCSNNITVYIGKGELVARLREFCTNKTAANLARPDMQSLHPLLAENVESSQARVATAENKTLKNK